MRQRKPKNLQERLNIYRHLLVEEPESQKGEWRGLFRERFEARRGETPCRAAEAAPGETDMAPDFETGVCADRRGVDTCAFFEQDTKLFLELGTGKGRFITSKAEADRGSLFIGVEGRESVILRALEKAEGAQLANVLFSRYYVKNALNMFAAGELDGIYLNFSDPWPKDRHEARRLTFGGRLTEYEKILKPGGFLEFKTDNRDFFDYSYREIDAANFTVVEVSTCLQDSQLAARFTLTEYEERFIRWRRDIYFIRAIIEPQFCV
ncbi:MAG: tRNA (guanosine(46)-N7)-methyltransferase TrmB [Clostridiales Family XIII bacterium]|jgi:tRNA (guanine-N7-)-methyltransferase|nr:tRNA (guanosine(46)-N7)-methyltransferase TrmB [Clostridiales Family XIII bacterium]